MIQITPNRPNIIFYDNKKGFFNVFLLTNVSNDNKIATIVNDNELIPVQNTVAITPTNINCDPFPQIDQTT